MRQLDFLIETDSLDKGYRSQFMSKVFVYQLKILPVFTRLLQLARLLIPQGVFTRTLCTLNTNLFYEYLREVKSFLIAYYRNKMHQITCYCDNNYLMALKQYPWTVCLMIDFKKRTPCKSMCLIAESTQIKQLVMITLYHLPQMSLK